MIQIKGLDGQILYHTDEYDLINHEFSGLSLRYARLTYAKLYHSNFTSTNIDHALLDHTQCTGAVFDNACLVGSSFTHSVLAEVSFKRASLANTDFAHSDLSGADFTGADLAGANFNSCNLSGVKGLPSSADFMRTFETDSEGVIVYKRIGNTDYPSPSNWKIRPGEFLTEVVNTNRTNPCGCGVNFGTKDWCAVSYYQADLWKCRIRWMDLADVVVPYNTDGKARCARLELLEKL